ncbi:MAG: hypothetical protein CMJ78_09705 [Planctomycetaceae bacterium]|nr:hypothetical protein [Planctomycetaceae bacterium]
MSSSKTHTFSRRRFIRRAGVIGAAAAIASQDVLWGAKAKVQTFVYKKVGKLDIHADVHRADDNKTRPVIVWVHGGALINGHRAGVSRRVLNHALDAGYAVVSIDYRLAPETQLPEIVSDLEDAISWVAKHGPRLFNVKTDRIAVAGGSAGGYMTLTSGFRAKPRPTVLLSLWGYGDLVGDWYSTPSPHKRHKIDITQKQAWAEVDGPPVSDSRERQGNGGNFYRYCRVTGTWPKAVSGWDPHKEAEKFFPYMAVKNVTKEYPPTTMIHGTVDTDVPYEQSAMMAEQFKKHGVEYQLHSIKNGEHGLAGADPEAVNAAYEKAFQFVDDHML